MRYVNCESFSKQRYVGLFAVHIYVSHYLAYDIFSLKLSFANNLHRSRMHFLPIRFCKQTNKQIMTSFSLSNKQRKKGPKRNEMITGIKMATILHAQTRCRSVHARGFTAGQTNCGKSGLGRWAITGRGSLDRPGPWAAGLSDCRAAGARACLAKPLMTGDESNRDLPNNCLNTVNTTDCVKGYQSKGMFAVQSTGYPAWLKSWDFSGDPYQSALFKQSISAFCEIKSLTQSK